MGDTSPWVCVGVLANLEGACGGDGASSQALDEHSRDIIWVSITVPKATETRGRCQTVDGGWVGWAEADGLATTNVEIVARR